jgi:putative phosphoesterase
MRILVVSDTHGDIFSLRLAIERQPAASMLIHLGDGEDDPNACSSYTSALKCVQVRGNCDFGSQAPPMQVVFAAGKRIFCSHGYAERVKYGDYELKEAARRQNADIALYGHTHSPVNYYEDGLYVFNPGSLHSGDYGVVDITKAGIVCINLKLF